MGFACWWHSVTPLREVFLIQQQQEKSGGFEMPAFWALLPAQTLTLSGGLAMKQLNGNQYWTECYNLVNGN